MNLTMRKSGSGHGCDAGSTDATCGCIPILTPHQPPYTPRKGASIAAISRAFCEEGDAEDGDHAWYGWQQAIALLGLRTLLPLIERAFADERIVPMDTGMKHFP